MIPQTERACHSGIWAVVGSVLAAAALVSATPAQAADRKPNILVIFGDDVGQSNISAFTMQGTLAIWAAYSW